MSKALYIHKIIASPQQHYMVDAAIILTYRWKIQGSERLNSWLWVAQLVGCQVLTWAQPCWLSSNVPSSQNASLLHNIPGGLQDQNLFVSRNCSVIKELTRETGKRNILLVQVNIYIHQNIYVHICEHCFPQGEKKMRKYLPTGNSWQVVRK